MCQSVNNTTNGRPYLALLGLVLATLCPSAHAAPAATSPDFLTEIAPILEAHCLGCHNPSIAKGGLSLSTLAETLTGGEEGAALVPNQSSRSRVIKKITPNAAGHADMPEDAPPLTPDQIQKLTDWIDTGAHWPDDITLRELSKADRSWWSLQPLNSAPPPPLPPSSKSANPIDSFIQARLSEEGLKPNPPADRSTLLRRVTYDLTGLPPTPQEAAAFLADKSPNAYEKVVDRLLASPRYGERWGRHWLDVVRFGESVGFEQNYLIENAWPFRDYIIKSFNDDKPFNQLIVEHLAGDVIGEGDTAVEIGSAFLVAGPHDTVNNQDAEQAAQIRANTLDEIIRATSETFLGLTVGCARCHDHKFDPIRQDDYYQLYATFAGVKHAARSIATPQQKQDRIAAIKPLEQEKTQIYAQRQTITKTINAKAKLNEASIAATWTRKKTNRYLTVDPFDPIEAKYIRLTVTNRDDIPSKTSDYRIDEFEVFDTTGKNVALASNGARAIGASRIAEDFANAYDVTLVNDGKFGVRWIAQGKELTIQLPQATLINRVAFSSDRNQDLGLKNRITQFVGEYRLHVSTDGKTWRQVAGSYDRQPITDAHREARLFAEAQTPAQKTKLAQLDKDIRRINSKINAIPNHKQWWAGQFNTAPGPFHVFKGGSPQQLGDTVNAASMWTLDSTMNGYKLPADAPESDRRLALAKWISDAKNPLTPRVLANRMWHYHFGTGIVDTPSDFGYMGGRPTHPKLLDWLAQNLLQNGWRIKPLHKLIVTSATYRQSSAYQTEAANIDADSRLLWRFPPRRLSGEELRDTFLAVAGKLDHASEKGGRGFRLYHFFRDNVSTYTPLDQHPPSTYRRAVYHQNARGQLIDLMTEFDCPDPTSAAPRRVATTTPLQALTLLNHSFTLDMAAALAKRAADENPQNLVRRIFELLYSRQPTATELTEAQAFAKTHGPDALCRAMLNTNALMYLD